MSDISFEALEELLDQMFDKKLEPIKETLDSHTESLQLLLSERQNKEDDKAITAHRLDRLEKWGKEAGKKLDISLEL